MLLQAINLPFGDTADSQSGLPKPSLRQLLAGRNIPCQQTPLSITCHQHTSVRRKDSVLTWMIRQSFKQLDFSAVEVNDPLLPPRLHGGISDRLRAAAMPACKSIPTRPMQPRPLNSPMKCRIRAWASGSAPATWMRASVFQKLELHSSRQATPISVGSDLKITTVRRSLESAALGSSPHNRAVPTVSPWLRV